MLWAIKPLTIHRHPISERRSSQVFPGGVSEEQGPPSVWGWGFRPHSSLSKPGGICCGTRISNLQVANPEVELCPVGMTASAAFVQGVRKCHAQTDLLGESPVQNKEGFFFPCSQIKSNFAEKAFCWEQSQDPKRKEASGSWINEPRLTRWSLRGISLRFSTWAQKASKSRLGW